MIKWSQRVTENQNRVNIADRMWARLLSSTNQPAFINADKRYIKKEPKVESDVESEVTNEKKEESEVTNKKKEELEQTNEKKEETKTTNEKKEESVVTNENKEETKTTNGAIILNEIVIQETKAD